MHKKLRKLNINLYNKHNELKFDNTVFDCIDTEEKAYWLGFLYADGSVSSYRNAVELSLQGKDIEHLEKYNMFLKNKKSVVLQNSKCNGKVFSRCRCTVTNKHFHQRLCELGCIPKKSLILEFPKKEIFKNEDLIIHFIRGYVDGDGSITFTKTGRLVLQIIGTKEFLTGIIDIFPNIFSKTFCKDKRLKNNTYFITCSCNKADYILEVLYKNSSIYLNRKYDRLAVLSRNW